MVFGVPWDRRTAAKVRRCDRLITLLSQNIISTPLIGKKRRRDLWFLEERALFRYVPLTYPLFLSFTIHNTMMYNTTMRFSFVLVFLVSILIFSGCKKRPDGLPKLFPVTVQIMSEGKPVTGASVLLFPEDSSSRWAGSAVTDTSGNANIQVLGQYNGTPVGKYTAIVTMVEIDQRGEDQYDAFDLIDPKFGDVARPAIQIEVKEEKNNIIQDVGPLVRIKQKQ